MLSFCLCHKHNEATVAVLTVLVVSAVMAVSSSTPPFFHWEIKGQFRKRVVLANVPSFRFSFRGNIRRNHPFGNHPFVNTKKGYWEIKGRFPKGWFWRTYPRSGFRSGGTSAKTTLLETTLLRTPNNEATVAVLTVLVVSAVMAVSSSTPPPFP